MMRSLPLICVLALVACGGGKDSGSGTTAAGTPVGTTPSTIDSDDYDFPSRFEPGTSSVSHSGQTMRQLLIKDLKSHLGGMTGRVDGGWFPESGDVAEELDFYFSFDPAVAAELSFGLTLDAPTLQTTYGDMGSDANLVGKIAGNDEVGQHADWSTAFVGWQADGVTTPESLVRHWFDRIDEAAVDRSLGTVPQGPDGQPVGAVYLTAEGQDLQQLLEKFLHGAVAFSQASDDYLDDDTEGKGLLADNDVAEEGKPYTALEHAWDEGFGYFGAAHHYAGMTDDDIADVGYSDRDGDGSIDLFSELCWGASTNAAKRDRGAVAPTDFTSDAWVGFHEGRALLAGSEGALTADELSELQAHRDQAIEAWEKALAATVVHYLNEVLVDMGTFGTNEYDFAGHSKHWSEAKGFALAFQFNPRSPLSDSDFAQLHTLLGQAPVLPTATQGEIDAYADDLRTARTLLGTAYGFDGDNLGDADGHGGW